MFCTRSLCQVPPREVIICKSPNPEVISKINTICAKNINKNVGFQPLEESIYNLNAGLFLWNEPNSQLRGLNLLSDNTVKQCYSFYSSLIDIPKMKFLNYLLKNCDEMVINSVEDFLKDKRVRKLDLSV